MEAEIDCAVLKTIQPFSHLLFMRPDSAKDLAFALETCIRASLQMPLGGHQQPL